MRAFVAFTLLFALALVLCAPEGSAPRETSITTPRLDDARVEFAATFPPGLPVETHLARDPRPPDLEPSAPADRAANGSVRIDVVLEIDGAVAGEIAPPVAELLRVDDGGRDHALGRAPPAAIHPALRAARGEPDALPERVVRSFTIDASGRYRAAWHAWCRVPGTRTWRAVRGGGPVVDASSLRDGDRLAIRIDASRLRPPPELDRPAHDANWTVTAKDG